MSHNGITVIRDTVIFRGHQEVPPFQEELLELGMV
jgi:hypothetical protein